MMKYDSKVYLTQMGPKKKCFNWCFCSRCVCFLFLLSCHFFVLVSSFFLFLSFLRFGFLLNRACCGEFD